MSNQPLNLSSIGDGIPITLNVNGHALELEVQPWETLLDLLRERLELTGSKKGHVRTREEIREQMSGNICRCGAYTNIVDAIEQVIAQDDAAEQERAA